MAGSGTRSTRGAPQPASPSADSIVAAEVAQFDRLSARWWDENGPMAPLHRITPVRLGYIRARLVERFGETGAGVRPLTGLRILDVGCGAGILSEPLARLGARVTGIDPGEAIVGAARGRAERQGLPIDYRVATVEALGAETGAFDAVIASEVVEHVRAPGRFVADCAALVAPGGLFLASTINRTRRAFAMAIVGAEYVLGLLPRGTHDWSKFVTPAEFEDHARAAGLRPIDRAGMIYNPLTGSWRLGRDTAVNYWITADRPS